MPLDEYRRKRKFGKTPEPPPASAPAAGRSFVVQKHDATRLHYDFRLEIGGVLVSWAVPKGPSLNPKDRRLAVHTEDHPLDYGHFEGVIPKGNYGAGPVEVWDNGEYEMEGPLDAAAQLERGELKFRLHGRKLRGSFALVHTGKRAEDPKERQNWLMIKHADEAADPDWDIERLDGSVLSGRTIREIEAGLAAPAGDPSSIPGARQAPMPAAVAPHLATLVERPFSDPGWIFELKWDGMRALAFLRQGKVELRSRTGRDVTSQFPELAVLGKRVLAGTAIVDGEAVVLDPEGRPDFAALQQRMHVAAPARSLIAKHPVIYYAFDLLYANGYDVREAPLAERKNLLKCMLVAEDPVRYSSHVVAEGEELFRLARERGLEGIIGKQARSKYAAGRTTDWVKLKTTSETEAVIGGFTAPRGSRERFGALLLGLYDGQKLRFIGGAGSGFNAETQESVWRELAPLITPRQPFLERPQTREKATWVEPRLVARVRFTSWTRDRHLRAPVFLGLRDDIDPRECVDEKPASVVSYGSTLRAATGASLTLGVEGHALKLTNLNKVFFPEQNLTKRDLLAYYADVSGLILPFLRDRPLTLRRMPDGVTGQLFYQKDVGEKMPPWIETTLVESGRGSVRAPLCNNEAALLWLTHLGCIDHNPVANRTDDPDHPDYFFLDLDPTDDTPFTTVIDVARAVCAVLDQAGMRYFPKLSGATGIHVFVPIERVYTWEQATTFAEIVSRMAATRVPDKVTFERIVARRPKNRVLLDYLQTVRGRSLASVYSVRPTPLATVSAPVRTDELTAKLQPEHFTLKSMPARLKQVGDLWAAFWQSRQRLEPALDRLRS